MSKLSIILDEGPLIYNFRLEKKKDINIKKYKSNKNYHKWKLQYPYPAKFSERYYFKNNKCIITPFRIMVLQ